MIFLEFHIFQEASLSVSMEGMCFRGFVISSGTLSKVG